MKRLRWWCELALDYVCLLVWLTFTHLLMPFRGRR